MSPAVHQTSLIRLGFIPLLDCAVLAVAQTEGFFVEEGLAVQLQPEPSWANIRDKLAAGLIDGAHALAPLVLASRLGLGAPPADLIAPMALNRGGAAITISTALDAAIAATPGGLKAVAAARGAADPLTFGVVFPFSLHSHLLRHWLRRQGVQAGRDVRVIVAPPPQMAQRLIAGELDGISVGAPWNLLAIESGAGAAAATAAQAFPRAIDKVFAVRSDWAQAHDETLQALLRALIRAAHWADAPDHRAALATLLAGSAYLGQPQALIHRALDRADIRFAGAVADGPDLGLLEADDARWLLASIGEGEALDGAADSLAEGMARPDLYLQARSSLQMS
jgi:NitT/TauT family transport system ATP-binding protein/nitrate/nitrite transport system substrate-binding protein